MADDNNALLAWKAFLESAPANASNKIPGLAAYDTTVSSNFRVLPRIQIQLHCNVDGGPRWFIRVSSHHFLKNTWEYEFITFRCKNCGQSTKTYAVLTVRAADDAADVEVMKLGEFPPYAAPISQKVERLLGKGDLELYRKGMRAEAQAFGIGAATYFRRVVDSQWKLLVTEIRDAASVLGEKDLSVFDAALAETQFSAAVEMLKDALPAKLLILDRQNPLTLLYRPLSIGLHDMSDDQCLQQAADIRTVLAALLENIGDVLKDQAELKAAAARLTQPRS
jgi:hypothetical protein